MGDWIVTQGFRCEREDIATFPLTYAFDHTPPSVVAVILLAVREFCQIWLKIDNLRRWRQKGWSMAVEGFYYCHIFVVLVVALVVVFCRIVINNFRSTSLHVVPKNIPSIMGRGSRLKGRMYACMHHATLLNCEWHWNRIVIDNREHVNNSQLPLTIHH